MGVLVLGSGGGRSARLDRKTQYQTIKRATKRATTMIAITSFRATIADHSASARREECYTPVVDAQVDCETHHPSTLSL